MLRLDGVSLTVAGQPLLDDLTWTLQSGQHVGLVGRNGTGKSTFLRALSDLHPVDEGVIERRKGLVVGYLPQGATEGSDASVWEVARSGLTQLTPLREALQQAQRDLEAGESHATEQLADATEAWRQAGGFAEDERVGSVLHGLGFTPHTWTKPCSTLSGGWQVRVALARLLLSEPDVALLDEPTNHLDLMARTWLAQFLTQCSFAWVLVSHDRSLLNSTTQSTLELRNGTLYRYHCAYDRFLIEREERMTLEAKHARRDRLERQKMERFVERFGAKNTKATQAKSIQKRLDKREALKDPKSLAGVARIRLPDPPPGVHETLALRDVTVGWTKDEPILEGVSLTLVWGQRVAILGPNGCGKSTLLHTLAGQLEPLSGTRRVGDRIRIGMFHQDSAQQLPPEEHAVGYVHSLVPSQTVQQVRGVLGALGLSGDDTLRPISSLSGGERARVALAALVVTPHNVLLLDEPTNHLDVETVGVLVDALAHFEGSLVVVTHDRALIENVATHLWRVEEDHVEVIEDPRSEHLSAREVSRASAGKSGGGDDYTAQKKRHRERERDTREMGVLETEIQELEKQLAVLEKRAFDVAHSLEEARQVEEERAAVAQKIQQNYTRWEALAEKLESP
jgi:ATP-binding cassette subfamily F protein 3